MKPFVHGTLLTAVILVLGLATGLAPRGDARVAVIGPPPGGFEIVSGMVATAGGAVVATGGLPWVVVASQGDTAFVERLYQAGAWLVIDAAAAAGCIPFAPLPSRPVPL